VIIDQLNSPSSLSCLADSPLPAEVDVTCCQGVILMGFWAGSWYWARS